MAEDSNPLPGFMPRPQYMRVVHNKTDFTGRRWQAKGQLVVEYRQNAVCGYGGDCRTRAGRGSPSTRA
jgi:hypothetical protein